jgi:hypothetical protein
MAGADSTRQGIFGGAGAVVLRSSKGSSGLSGEPGRGDQIAGGRDHGGSES